MKLSPVAVILGATGAGKTGLAIRLAQELGAEIISADSLQVYREMDIGTAKPTPEQRAAVPHHLIDVVFPDEEFDAAQYCRRGRQVIADLHARRIPPLVVGGTGLYIKALLQGLFDDQVQDRVIRNRLRQELATLGLPELYARLHRLDPKVAIRLHPNDAFRILRALEVIEANGQPLSRLQQAHRFQDRPYRVLKLGLALERDQLYDRINARVEEMLAQGFLTEVEALLSRYDRGLKPFQALGYRHLISYLQDGGDWEATIDRLKRDTRRYAKRQMTWFRADPEIYWLAPDHWLEIRERLREFFNQLLSVRDKQLR
ncbi:MAG: tRNA (adenosine(37)-N6)-dimethylallyltransferase MiaA [Deltaproteobacteria bacterium]|nr:tRNA (adenosine(37)-N6)-dimethylallyltransferase MiaA [Deltaproteobacteria bacterium]MBW1986595.1 tRNA (adenosine(37)-N6)-dimethylallyltransferase MiaA [Deltaproteobacteria bacterium]